MKPRRVVITGLGGVTSLGWEIEDVWSKLLKGTSGVSRIERFDTEGFDVTFGGEIKGFDPTRWMSTREARHYDLFSQYGIAAADGCIQDSGVDFDAIDPYRAGVILGTGIGGISEFESQHSVLRDRGPSRVSPFLIPKMMANSVSGLISIRHGLMGINYVGASACASGSNARGHRR